MKLIFRQKAWHVYVAMQADDPDLARRVDLLIVDVMRSPFRGLGKPEPLNAEFAGWWSRRVSQEHRLIYRLAGKGDDQLLEILQCGNHH